MEATPLRLGFGVFVGVIAVFGAAAAYWLITGKFETKSVLLSVGTALQVVGVLLIASPELRPRTSRVTKRLLGRLYPFLPAIEKISAGWDSFGNKWRVRFGKAFLDTLKLAYGPRPIATEVPEPPKDATAEEFAEYVFGLLRVQSKRLDSIENSYTASPDRWLAAIAKAREELESETDLAIRKFADLEIRMRLLGVLYVVVGIVLAFAGTI